MTGEDFLINERHPPAVLTARLTQTSKFERKLVPAPWKHLRRWTTSFLARQVFLYLHLTINASTVLAFSLPLTGVHLALRPETVQDRALGKVGTRRTSDTRNVPRGKASGSPENSPTPSCGVRQRGRGMKDYTVTFSGVPVFPSAGVPC